MSFGVPLSALGIFSSKSYKNDSLYLIHTLVMNVSRLTENENSSKSPLSNIHYICFVMLNLKFFYGHFLFFKKLKSAGVAGRGRRTGGFLRVRPLQTLRMKDAIGWRSDKLLSEVDGGGRSSSALRTELDGG